MDQANVGVLRVKEVDLSPEQIAKIRLAFERQNAAPLSALDFLIEAESGDKIESFRGADGRDRDRTWVPGFGRYPCFRPTQSRWSYPPPGTPNLHAESKAFIRFEYWPRFRAT